MKAFYLTIALAPLVGSLIAGLGCRKIGKRTAHTVTITGVAISAILSIYNLIGFNNQSIEEFNENIYTWLSVGGVNISVGFMIDSLSSMMMVVVSSVSLMVHIYTIGYMKDDDGYQRFFSYISLFTFSMLMLVMSNNFLQLFFGWEAVGLVSYLLIGFWFKKPTAIFANLKAFLINRVGDFGFVLGIGLVMYFFGGSLDYKDVFSNISSVVGKEFVIIPGVWTTDVITATCILLFVGAMGKSAQFPLHVWLPDSMEGPTPISALIHAATMVTAGIFMVSRMSPIYELSDTALSFILIIGSITALFMGLLGIIQNDIKRVVAYSTLSQLGYMTVALGVSAYPIALFHLMTHAFFKALLFLAAGSVIIGMHHDQDMRNMGGLRKHMPITWITLLIGTLALIGFPFTSGFYSKDSIIEIVHESEIFGSGFAYFSVWFGAFITSFYSFRLYFLVFHGKERWHDVHKEHHGHDDHDHHHGLKAGQKPHESPWVVTLPLTLLAIPSVLIGYFTVNAMTSSEHNYFSNVFVDYSKHPGLEKFSEEIQGPFSMAIHGFSTSVFALVFAGFLLSWYFYMKRPDIPQKIKEKFSAINELLEQKYYMDHLYIKVFARMGDLMGRFFWRYGDQAVIDNTFVNGSAKLVNLGSKLLRRIQTGFIFSYAASMAVGIIVLLGLWLIGF